MEKLLLRPAEAAEMMGVSRSTIYQLMSDGTVPSVKIGHCVRIPTAAIRQWVENKIKEVMPSCQE